MEAIGDRAADVTILMTLSGDRGVFEALSPHPLAQALPAVREGRLVRVDGAAVLGPARGKPMAGLAAFAKILLRGDLNRDLVRERRGAPGPCHSLERF